MSTFTDILPHVGWGSYDKWEGPWYPGTVPYEAPDDSFLSKAGAVITATEGGKLDAVNMYDRCVLTVGFIQWGEACANRAVSRMLAKARERAPEWVDKTLMEAGLGLTDEPALMGAGVTATHSAILGGSSGLKGQWQPAAKGYAKRVAAAVAAVWQDPACRQAQYDFTLPKLLDFSYGDVRRMLFPQNADGSMGFREDGWEGALRAIYISFAANLPAVAARRVNASLMTLPPKTACISLAKALTFDPGIAIYPGRYDKIRPVVEKLFAVDLPDFHNELRMWKLDMGENVDRFPDVASWQQALIALGYDLGTAGADGRSGPKTIAAVRAFQLAASVQSDGVVGKLTLNALARAVDGKPKS